MKKNLLKSLAFAAVATLTFAPVAAQTATGPSPLWAKVIDTPNADGGVAATISGNAIYALNLPGIKKAADIISYGGTEIATGGIDMTGYSTNNSFLLTKSGRDGSLLWTIQSTLGDFYSSGSIAPTHDGGVVVGFSVRHTDKRLSEKVGFKDAKGKTVELDWTLANDAARYRKAAVMKVSPEGEIQWIRTISPDGSYSKSTGDVTIAGLAEGKDNELYVGAQFCDTITIDAADGTDFKTLIPNNGEKGNALVAKYSADGTPEAVAISSSTDVVTENIGALRYADGSIYTFGYIDGNADSAVKYNFGEGLSPIEVPAGDAANLVATKFNGELTPQWTRLFPGSKVNGNSDIQPKAIDVDGEDVFLTGNLRGTIKADNSELTFSTTTEKKLYEGFIARISAANGDLLAGTTSSVDYQANEINGYSGALTFSGKENVVYAYGYALFKSLYLRAYDRQTLAAASDGQWNLVTSTPTSYNIVLSGDTIYSYSRVQKSNASLTDGTALKAEGYGALLAAYKLPAGTVTGIASAHTAEGVSISAARGSLTITAAQPQTVTVFAADGRAVANVSVNGTATVALPAGIYVVAGQKAAVN